VYLDNLDFGILSSAVLILPFWHWTFCDIAKWKWPIGMDWPGQARPEEKFLCHPSPILVSPIIA